MSRESWRSVSAPDAAYLRQLAAWGYVLSEVEQIIPDADDARRAQRDADGADGADESAVAVVDTTEPEADTEGSELDTAAVEDGPETIAAPVEDPEADPDLVA